jgi:IS4 transposase
MQLNQELRYGINKYSTYIEFKNKVESSKKKLKQIFLKLKKKTKKLSVMEQQLSQAQF